MLTATSHAFKENAHHALGDRGLQKALARSGPSFIARRAAAVAGVDRDGSGWSGSASNVK